MFHNKGVHLCDKRSARTDYSEEFPRVDCTMLDTEDDTLWEVTIAVLQKNV